MPVLIETWLREATCSLVNAGIGTARLDCLVLLEDVLQNDRSVLLAYPELNLTVSEEKTLNTFITQRRTHLPLAYIRGKIMFYGREFVVNKYVLVPRPETESIITLLKNIAPKRPARIADIGTGSGCIGITAALELTGSTIYLYDVDSEALKVAFTNATRHNVSVQTGRQDLLMGCNEQFDVVLANLPYVPTGYPINRAAVHEPPIALYAGRDGLEHYHRLWQQIGGLESTRRPTYVITESMPRQHPALRVLAYKARYELMGMDGYAQAFALRA